MKELFKSIQKYQEWYFRYTPILTDLDTKLKAFIPDYIPAVGEVDAFLKMPRPDDQPEVLGLNILVSSWIYSGWTVFEPVRQSENLVDDDEQ